MLVLGLVVAMFALLLRLPVPKIILVCISPVIIISQSVCLAVPVIWIKLCLCLCMFFNSMAPLKLNCRHINAVPWSVFAVDCRSLVCCPLMRCCYVILDFPSQFQHC